MRSDRAIVAIAFAVAVGSRAYADQPGEEFDLKTLEAVSEAQMENFIAEAKSLAQGAAARPPVDIQELAAATAAGVTAAAAEHVAREVATAVDGAAEQGRENRTIVPPEFIDSLYIGNAARITVFVSRSLGRQALIEIFEELRHYPNARAVLRGIAEGQSLGDGIKEILALAQPDGEGRVPNIEIDPVAFTRHDVTAVPAMIAEQERTGELLLRVDGGTSVAFLTRALQDLESSPDSPREIRVGSLTAIEEQDLIERAKTALVSLDLDGMRRDALDRAFARVTADRDHARYPVAKVHRRRIVDPTIEVAAPLGGRAGDHLSSYVRAGTRINPLDMRPFRQVLVILDPTDAGQRAAVEAALVSHLTAHPERRATWIATRLDGDAGWDGLAAIEDRLNSPVYLIDERLRERFQIERVPSFVYQEDRAFVVEEIAPPVER